ncbi:uncharacterized protein PAN0_121d6769 [Moesziomyces antarcticus]|uniref:Uncharacterized protein n=1 Tax=Pseudozyma antarctica TaxID=84753 RepID=A0A081CPB2_PSEA2|nr:uncharacterized protein PAN0_121d6769 [Moesziomyces antarcticus]GAK68508.1 hypothetical protein PAN0_121d6769 [Moesziomyces antarcticus]
MSRASFGDMRCTGVGPAAGLAAGEIAETSLEARVRPRQARIAGVQVTAGPDLLRTSNPALNDGVLYGPTERERAKLAAPLHREADEVDGVTPGALMEGTSQNQPATRSAPRTGEQMPCDEVRMQPDVDHPLNKRIEEVTLRQAEVGCYRSSLLPITSRAPGAPSGCSLPLRW